MRESQISYRVCILGVNGLGSRWGHSRYLYVHYANKNLSTDELQLTLTLEMTTIQGPVVRTPVSANPGLNFNQGCFFLSSKELSRMIFIFF